MASYEIRFKKSVARDLRRIPSQDVQRILDRIDALSEDPRPIKCTRLAGLDNYRVRVGHYRILDQIEDHYLVIQIIKIAHLSTFYRNL
ncbi:MAG: mRNA interferase RelE/StbE [Candidatus Azotimanducaceae bacterium]|jgi:mRNA interferase RelE/StbE